MNTRALLVEDEPLAIDRLRTSLAFVENIDVIGEARDGRRAIDLINSLSPDLVFLDVQLPLYSGFEVLRSVRNKPAVIFTTAHHEYAVPAFEWGAFDYLLKPFDHDRVALALERYRQRSGFDEGESEFAERLQTTESKGLLQRFFVKQRGIAIPIAAEDIVAIVAEGDYCRVCTNDGAHLIHLPLREFQHRLNPQYFKRVHRSAMIQIRFIQRIEMSGRGALLHMPGGLIVSASRTGLSQLRSFQL